MIREAIILAGGLGTRLRKVVQDKPKPMADINGKPFLVYLFEFLNDQGIERCILAVGFKKNVIINYFGDRYKNMDIIYSEENEPLGTGGALKRALEKIKGNFSFVLNGDTYFKIDLKLLEKFSIEREVDLCIALKYMEDNSRYGTVNINSEYRIIGFQEKEKSQRGYINGGVYLIRKNLLTGLPEKFSFEKEFLEKYYKYYRFYGIPFDTYFIDIGVPEDYEKAKRDFKKLEY